MKTWEYPILGLLFFIAVLSIRALRRRRRHQKFDLPNFLRAQLIKAKLL
jgi:hypothetical protein